MLNSSMLMLVNKDNLLVLKTMVAHSGEKVLPLLFHGELMNGSILLTTMTTTNTITCSTLLLCALLVTCSLPLNLVIANSTSEVVFQLITLLDLNGSNLKLMLDKTLNKLLAVSEVMYGSYLLVEVSSDLKALLLTTHKVLLSQT